MCFCFIGQRSSMSSQENKRKHGEQDLATDDGNGGKSLPERRESVVVSATIVTEHGAGPLDPVNQTDQALHGRHLSQKCDEIEKVEYQQKPRNLRLPVLQPRSRKESIRLELDAERPRKKQGRTEKGKVFFFSCTQSAPLGLVGPQLFMGTEAF